jgi:hypothetical protein
MKEISSLYFPQHGEVFYFYGQALLLLVTLVTDHLPTFFLVKGLAHAAMSSFGTKKGSISTSVPFLSLESPFIFMYKSYS